MALINPYDQCGILHNELCDYLIAQNVNPTDEEFLNDVAAFCATEFDDSTPIFKREMKILAGQAINYAQFSSTNTGYTIDQLILNNSTLNGQQLNFQIKILEPSTNPPTTTFWEDLETEILESSLTEIEMAPLLCAVSVAKHSLDYWTNATTDPLNPWYSPYGATIQIPLNVKVDYTIMTIGAAWVGVSWLVARSNGHPNRKETWNIITGLLISAIMAGAASAYFAEN